MLFLDDSDCLKSPWEIDGLIKQLGARVVRGKDWKYNNQDGGGDGSQLGTISSVYCSGFDWLEVTWDNDCLLYTSPSPRD